MVPLNVMVETLQQFKNVLSITQNIVTNLVFLLVIISHASLIQLTSIFFFLFKITLFGFAHIVLDVSMNHCLDLNHLMYGLTGNKKYKLSINVPNLSQLPVYSFHFLSDHSWIPRLDIYIYTN